MADQPYDDIEKTDGSEVKGDENKERGNWGSPVEFVLSCIGYCVGLGNLWRFPYLCYRNGGAVFLIPYAIMSAFVGLPIFVMELSLGQFSSSGPLTCWKFSRLFSGLGWGMVIVTTLVSIYYNMIIGWAIYYLIASFFELPRDLNALPWMKCIKGEASDYCSDFIKSYAGNCTAEYGLRARDDGVCVYLNGTMNSLSGKAPLGFWNESLAASKGLKESVPSESYLFYHVWGRGNITDLNNLGRLKWELALCLLAAWIMVYFALLKGIKSSGKVVYFTAVFPYVMLIILLIRGVMLDGHYEGVKFYMSADLTKLTQAQVWKDAATQVFFSLSASWGGLITLSSYNKFRNDCVRDSIIVAVGDSLTSFFSGFVIFSYLGYLAKEYNKPIESVVSSGTGLAFIVYTRAVASLPGAPAWAILFFLTILTLGCDSQFALVETILTSVLDSFPKTRKKKWLVLLIICITLYCLGLTLCTEAGTYLLDLLDTYSGGWNVLIIAVLECIAVAYVYGVTRFHKDIQVMISKAPTFKIWPCFKWYLAACWCLLTPGVVLFVMGFDMKSYKKLKYDNGQDYHDWAEALGWLCTVAVMSAIILVPIYHLFKEEGSFSQKFLAVVRPSVDWGPALVEHRRLVTYVDGWVIDPHEMTLFHKNSSKELSEFSNSAYVAE